MWLEIGVALILPAANICFYWFIVVFAGDGASALKVTAKDIIFLLVTCCCVVGGLRGWIGGW